MDSQQFLNLKQRLKPGQSLVLDYDNKVRIIGPKKKDFLNMGFLELWDEMVLPLKNKLWSTPPIPGKQKYWKFGESLPKFDRIHSDEYKIKIKTALGIFEALKSMEFVPKISYWTNQNMGFSYYIEELGGVKVYFDSKENRVIRYVEFEGEKMIIPQLKPDGIKYPK
jgi:hypothetical protein